MANVSVKITHHVERKINFAIMDNLMMRRCIQLANLGKGKVSPNPLVGAVVVHNEKIIGEGWHQKFGEAHAEVNAINDVADQSLLTKSVLYVNLEPCCHKGKTPPCTKFIISKGIPKVVIGMQDPFSKVNGEGIRELIAAGIEVIIPVCEKECSQLNRRFITFHNLQRPYIILKWAQSADGFIGRENEKVAISNHLTQILLHQWRAAEDAIFVGTKTVLIDDPHLNVRNWFGKQPLRITIDQSLVIPANANIFDGSQPTIIYTSVEHTPLANVVFVKLDPHKDILVQIMNDMYERSIQSVLVEGGALLLHSFINAGLFDEVRIFHSPKMMHSGIKAPGISNVEFSEALIGDNRLAISKKIIR